MEINEHRKRASGRRWPLHELWIPAMIWMAGLMITKLFLFDIFCRAEMSWEAMAGVQAYVRLILSSFILSVPIGMFRRRWIQVVVFAAADTVLLCGSPAQTVCVGWLLPGTMTGTVSLHAWGYPLLPLTTVAAVIVALKYRGLTPVPMQGKIQYCGYLIGWSFMAWLTS